MIQKSVCFTKRVLLEKGKEKQLGTSLFPSCFSLLYFLPSQVFFTCFQILSSEDGCSLVGLGCNISIVFTAFIKFCFS